jgi:hypothetical protein
VSSLLTRTRGRTSFNLLQLCRLLLSRRVSTISDIGEFIRYLESIAVVSRVLNSRERITSVQQGSEDEAEFGRESIRDLESFAVFNRVFECRERITRVHGEKVDVRERE